MVRCLFRAFEPHLAKGGDPQILHFIFLFAKNRKFYNAYNRRERNKTGCPGFAVPFNFFLGERNIMLESRFQSGLIKELKERFPGCIVLKNDADYIQGIPDLLVLHNNRWAALECKRDSKAVEKSKVNQPSQHYYVERMNDMSYASYICPENKKEVLNELEHALESDRETCTI